MEYNAFLLLFRAFSAAVSVVGALRIKMETGAIDRYAVYVNGTNTTVLTFEYVVETGDGTSLLDYHSDETKFRSSAAAFDLSRGAVMRYSARPMLAADVHPLIFQSFKSAWVLLTSLLVLIPIATEEHTIQLTWWGVASAAGWVPSGLCTIFAVSTIGLSMAIVVSCASAAVLSFLVFWLVFQEKIKEHTIDGHTVYLAPAYLAAIVVGMAGLVFAPRLAGRRGSKKANGDSPPSPSAEQLMPVVADVEGELKRYVARYVGKQIDKPEIRRMRDIDVRRRLESNAPEQQAKNA